MEQLNAIDLRRKAGESLEVEGELWKKTENEVRIFLITWHEELLEGEKVRKVLDFGDPWKIFTSSRIAKMILRGCGLKVIFHQEETKGLLWWKMTKPAHWEIVPEKLTGWW